MTPEDAATSLTLLPELRGAVTADVRLTRAFVPFDDSGSLDALPLLGLDVAAGYKHFFDIHGALALAARLHGGAAWPEDESAPLGHVGAELGFGGRGYSPHFFFGELGAVVAADLLLWEGAVGEALRSGWRVSLGLETDLGMLLVLDPALFGALGALIEVDWFAVGPLEGTSVTLHWLVRFDVALRERTALQADPDGDALDELFRAAPAP